MNDNPVFHDDSHLLLSDKLKDRLKQIVDGKVRGLIVYGPQGISMRTVARNVAHEQWRRDNAGLEPDDQKA